MKTITMSYEEFCELLGEANNAKEEHNNLCNAIKEVYGTHHRDVLERANQLERNRAESQLRAMKAAGII